MKVLIIDFYYSTTNVGGLRWQKFAKYLPEHGICPIILTSGEKDQDDDNVFHVPFLFNIKSSHGFAVGRDESFLGRVKRWIRGNFFIPDVRRLWFAYGLAKDLVRRYSPDVVITTGPPHSVHLIGLRLKRNFGIKWIADFRDPWFPYWYKDLYLIRFAMKLQYRLMYSVLHGADVCIAVEERIINPLDIGEWPNSKIVSNGFDPDDFSGEQPEVTNEFVYVGSLTDRELLPPINFKHVQNVSHKEAIKEMRQAGYLLVAYPDDVIPSKIYEYMASGQPILSFGINGKGAELIERCGVGVHYLRPIIIEDENIGEPELIFHTQNRNESEIQKYSVKNITKQLAEIIWSVKDA